MTENPAPEAPKGPPDTIHGRLIELAGALSLAAFNPDGSIVSDLDYAAALAEASASAITAALAMEASANRRDMEERAVRMAALNCKHEYVIGQGGDSICRRCNLPHSLVERVEKSVKAAGPRLVQP